MVTVYMNDIEFEKYKKGEKSFGTSKSFQKAIYKDNEGKQHVDQMFDIMIQIPIENIIEVRRRMDSHHVFIIEKNDFNCKN